MASNSELILEKFKKVSTATIATSLFKRGLKKQYVQNVFPLKKGGTTMVGQAYTLRYIPAREDLNTIDAFKDPKHLQRVAVEECPKGFILLIDSRKDARAASAGAILITRLMKRGAAGIVTDGGFRDSAEISKLDFSAYHKHPSAPTNLTLHHAIGINEPIGCGDVAVFPNDYVIGDDDGVIIVPYKIGGEVSEECLNMSLFEDFVIEKVNEGQSIIGLYPPTNPQTVKDFDQWRAAKNQNSSDD